MSAALAAYLPMDRRYALARGHTLPARTTGAALFADISGFTPLTEALVLDLGPQRGAEVLAHHLNIVYDALIAQLHDYGGSVIGFSGDAVTCWLDGDDGARATTCALLMQRAMSGLAAVTTPSGRTVRLAMKAAVATGPVRRFLVGDPAIQVAEVLAGAIMERLAAAEHWAVAGEVVLDPAAASALGERAQVAALRVDEESGQCFTVVAGLADPPPPCPWPALADDTLPVDLVRSWLVPAVQERLLAGQGEFLAELRPAVALFLRFGGLDYDRDDAAGAKLDAYLRWVQRGLAIYDGTFLQLTIGDKGSYLYAAFGAPRAHEDDAARAAAAALILRETPEDCGFIDAVQIGLGWGRMRTGAYGGHTSRTYGVLGDAVNLAARLMQAATPGQILASREVRRGAGDDFRWGDMPSLRVKGKAEPVAIGELRGRVGSTIRLHEPRYELPMVGRRAELALALERLGEAQSGQGRIVALIGEAGLGKSRLVAEIVRLATEQGVPGHGGECPAYGANVGYLVWRAIWRGLFGIGAEDSPEEVAAAARAALATLDPELLPRLPLLGPVLGAALPDNDLTAAFDAKLRKTSLEALLVACLRTLAGRGPLLLVLEDCHWLDDLSHDLLEAIGRAVAGLPVLIVMTYRPPQAERLQASRVSSLPHFTPVPLGDLPAGDAEQLIRQRFRQHYGASVAVPEVLIERITARAQGNPFYIEELLNDLRDKGIAPGDAAAVARLDLPSSLHSLILTRIDRLVERQRVTLKVASVVGRVFQARALLGALPALDTLGRIDADLDELRRLDLVPLEREDPELTYLFKHIVTQEVAYESLPFATRETLHGRLADFLERGGQGTAPPVELLAFHYGRSDNAPKKREYLLKAGAAAQAAYANAAAAEYYRAVLPLLPEAEQAAVLLRLGQVHELTGQWDEADGCYRRALARASDYGDRALVARAQRAMGELLRKRGAYDAAAEQLTLARAGFEAAGDEAGVGEALHYAGSLAAQRGNFEAARESYTTSLAIRRRLNDLPRIASLLNNLGIVARYQGDLVTARMLHEEGLAIRRSLGDRWAIANSLNNLGNVALDEGQLAESRARLEEATQLQREVGDPWALANSLNNLANVARAQGAFAAAHALYRESLLINRDLDDRWALAYLLEDVAVLRTCEGDAQGALILAGGATALRAAIGAPRSSAEEEKLARGLTAARECLDEQTQGLLLARGQALPLGQMLDETLGGLATADGRGR